MLDCGGWSTSRPGSFPPGKEISYPLYGSLFGSWSRSERVRKISPPLGFDSRVVQLVACRSTDYAIPPHLYLDTATKSASRHFLFLPFLRSLWHVIQQHNEWVNFITARIFVNHYIKILHTFQTGHRPSDHYTTYSYETRFNIILLPKPQFKRLKILFLRLLSKCQYWGADKSLARPGRKQARKHVRDARDFNNIETRAVIKLQGKTRRRRKLTPFWQKH